MYVSKMLTWECLHENAYMRGGKPWLKIQACLSIGIAGFETTVVVVNHFLLPRKIV